jgi:hypothetical protein
MQAEEMQKELDELKVKTVADHESSQSDSVELRTRLTAVEQERDNIATKLESTDFEKNEAVKRTKDLELRENRLLEQITKLHEVCRIYKNFSIYL